MKPLTDEQREALAQEMDAVERTARIAARRFNGRVTFEEALSSASYGAMRATSTHDASKGRTLRSHIYTRANGQVIDDVRSNLGRNRKTGNPSAYRPGSLDATDENGRARVLAVAYSSQASVDDNESANALMKKIAPSCRATQMAMRMVWIEGYSMRETANTIGLSESMVSKMLTKAKAMGKALLNRSETAATAA